MCSRSLSRRQGMRRCTFVALIIGECAISHAFSPFSSASSLNMWSRPSAFQLDPSRSTHRGYRGPHTPEVLPLHHGGRGFGLLRMTGSGAGVKLHQGLKELADKYDAFLVDQWGVMHDGTNAYEGATECMKQLTAMGKKVVLLSNSSRRKDKSMTKLDTMGFDSKSIIDLVTSGETAWKGFTAAEKYHPFDQLGNKAFVFGNGEEDEEYVKACGLTFAEVEQADFILARGMFTMHDSEDILMREGPDAFEMWDAEALRVLQIAAARQLPMLVTNPDFVRPDGKDSPMPGKLGTMYESVLANNMFGGRLVYYIGKPHPLVYDEAFRILAEETGGAVAKERVCGVGDSLHHDIEGALRYGIDSIWIANGVHYQDMGLIQGKMGQEVDMSRLESTMDTTFTRPPNFVLPHFQWEAP